MIYIYGFMNNPIYGNMFFADYHPISLLIQPIVRGSRTGIGKLLQTFNGI